MITHRELLKLMTGSKYGNYPLVHIADYGGSDVEGDFGYVDEVLALNDEYAFLLDATVTDIDFDTAADGGIYLDIQVQS